VSFCPCFFTLRISISFGSLATIFAGSFTSWENVPIEGELSDIETIDYHPHNDLSSDKGPAQDQTDPGEISGMTNSSVLLPDPDVDINVKITCPERKKSWKGQCKKILSGEFRNGNILSCWVYLLKENSPI
jgi:hypothetical protein